MTAVFSVVNASTYPAPCEAAFERMAREDPQRLLAWVASGELRPGFLTYAAEHAGLVDDSAAVRAVLVPLLDHPSPLVREGALLGLSRSFGKDGDHLDEATLVKLHEMAMADTSTGVRRTVQGIVADWGDHPPDPERT